MKKIFPLLMLAILISSCGNRLTLMKRHYTKGYYVQSSSGAMSTTGVKEGSHKQTGVTMNPSPTTLSVPMTGPVMATTLKISEQNITAKANRSSVSRVEREIKNEKISFRNKRSFQHSAFKESKKGGGGNANIVVLVILCLFPFINLIAMYLHDGGVTTNFWICLLLDVLFFLPGIIFALLVVLDLVNLA